MAEPFHKLKLITESLLSPVLNYRVLNEAVQSLNKLFCSVVDFDELEITNQNYITTNAGKAIAPRWAASCITDMMRTRKFILGIRDAIEERLKMNPGKPVIVMYAGTGPFASLLTPLITVFSPAQLQMVLIEINPVSICFLEKIIRQFGMENYLIDLVHADAVTYSISENQQPDIIVSETMNNALQKEPQVSIVANLLSQSNRKPFFIPELIKVDVCLLGNIVENPVTIISLKTLMELDAATAVSIKNNPGDIQILSSGIIVDILSLPDPQYKQLVLCTEIKVFGQHNLGYNESGITIPLILMMTDAFKKFPVHLLFQYHVDNNPGFRVREV